MADLGRFEWERLLRDPEHRPPDLSATDLHVALTMATWANADGTSVRPSTRTVAAAAGRSRSTVRVSLARLQEAGVLVEVEPATRVRPAVFALGRWAGEQSTGGPDSGPGWAGEQSTGGPDSGPNHNKTRSTPPPTPPPPGGGGPADAGHPPIKVEDWLHGPMGIEANGDRDVHEPVTASIVRAVKKLLADGYTFAQLAETIDPIDVGSATNPPGLLSSWVKELTPGEQVEMTDAGGVALRWQVFHWTITHGPEAVLALDMPDVVARLGWTVDEQIHDGAVQMLDQFRRHPTSDELDDAWGAQLLGEFAHGYRDVLRWCDETDHAHRWMILSRFAHDLLEPDDEQEVPRAS